MAKNYAELIQGINQGIPDNDQGLVSPSDIRENMIDLADWANELPDIENVKGAYNASTNTPTLTATPDPTFNDGAYYDVTVGGTVGFAGVNFTSGTVLNIGDKLKKMGTQWYRIPFSIADKSITATKLVESLQLLLSYINQSNDNFNGIAIVDKNGYIGVKFINGVMTISDIVSNNINSSKVNNVSFSNSNDYAFVTVDAMGFISGYISNDGKIKSIDISTNTVNIKSVQLIEENGKLVVKNSTSNQTIFKAGLDLEISSSEDEIIISDKNGNIGFKIRNGKILNIDSFKINKQPNIRAEVEMIIGYGQSLSLGARCVPIVNTTQKYKNIMFQGGIRAFDNADNTNSLASFVPMVENVSPLDSQTGETPMSSMCNTIVELLNLENGISYLDSDYSILGACLGSGGLSIAQLSKGATGGYDVIYNRIPTAVASAKSLCITQNKSLNVTAVYFNQGEADFGLNTNQTTYYNALIQLYNDINTDVKTITGQSNDIKMFLYQTNNQNSVGQVGNVSIAQAQLEASINHPNIYMSAPIYWGYFADDNIHFQTVSSMINGAYHGIAYKRVIHDNEDFNPIYPIVSNIIGNAIEIKFNVPKPPLILDTINISNPGMFGFRVFNASNVEQSITSVSLSKFNTIKIICSSTPQVGWYITYAVNSTTNLVGARVGARGNLRDSNIFNFNSSKVNVNLYNWCPQFKQVIT